MIFVQTPRVTDRHESLDNPTAVRERFLRRSWTGDRVLHLNFPYRCNWNSNAPFDTLGPTTRVYAHVAYLEWIKLIN